MAITIRSSADGENFITTYPGYLILVFGIPFAFIVVICVLGYFGFLGCVMGNGVKHCFRRRQKRREEGRLRDLERDNERWFTREYKKRLRMERENDREQEKIRGRERQAWEKAQKRARRYGIPQVTAPEAAYIPASSSFNFNESHPTTHGSSVRIPGSDSLYNDPAANILDTRSRIVTWNSGIEQGSAPAPPDSVSLHMSAGSQGRARLQKRDRSTRATGRSQPFAHIQDNVSVYSSVGSSSRLFDGRDSTGQRSTSALGLLSERGQNYH